LAKALRDQGITVAATTTSAGATQYSLTLNGSDAQSNYKVTGGGSSKSFDITNTNGTVIATITASINNGMTGVASAYTVSAAESTSEVFSYYDKNGNAISANDLSNYYTGDGTTANPRADAPKAYDALGKEKDLDKKYVTADKHATQALSLKFHVGADGTSNNQITINIDTMNAKGLGINGLRVDGSDDTNATKAVSTISAAIKKVSTQRSALGAVQNRLEHTINNLNNIVENTTSAESSIRDTDMATEMVTYSNANILSQAGQAMLAQSNQSNQGVLSLLG
jgi:flagellin